MVTRLVNVRYLSGFTGSNAALLVTADAAVLATDGRYITQAEQQVPDLERVIEASLETGVALEVNGLPARLDLSGEHVREAIEAGARIVVSTDAHSIQGLGNMELAVHTARRGWATAANVVNTRPLSEFLR